MSAAKLLRCSMPGSSWRWSQAATSSSIARPSNERNFLMPTSRKIWGGFVCALGLLWLVGGVCGYLQGGWRCWSSAASSCCAWAAAFCGVGFKDAITALDTVEPIAGPHSRRCRVSAGGGRARVDAAAQARSLAGLAASGAGLVRVPAQYLLPTDGVAAFPVRRTLHRSARRRRDQPYPHAGGRAAGAVFPGVQRLRGAVLRALHPAHRAHAAGSARSSASVGHPLLCADLPRRLPGPHRASELLGPGDAARLCSYHSVPGADEPAPASDDSILRRAALAAL